MQGSLTPSGSPDTSPWWTDLVRHYPVFRRLPPSLAGDLRVQGGQVHLPAGTIAFDEDSPCTGLVLLTQGSVRVVRSSPQGREIMLYRVSPGEICILSVSCLLGRSPISARGIVEGNLVGVSVPARLFETMVSECPTFRVFIFEFFGGRIGDLLQLLEEVAFHRLDHRLATYLLRLFAGGTVEELEVTHQELADQMGTARETISRMLASLEQQGCVALSRGRMRLRNPEILRDLAGPMMEGS